MTYSRLLLSGSRRIRGGVLILGRVVYFHFFVADQSRLVSSRLHASPSLQSKTARRLPMTENRKCRCQTTTTTAAAKRAHWTGRVNASMEHAILFRRPVDVNATLPPDAANGPRARRQPDEVRLSRLCSSPAASRAEERGGQTELVQWR